MKKGAIIGIVIVVLVILVGVYFLMNSSTYKLSSTPQNNSSQTIPSVSIKNFVFNPVTISVKVGESVIWINEDSAPHTIVSDSGSEISSSSLSSGQTYTHTFNTTGTYDYHCGIHTSMKGKVIVN